MVNESYFSNLIVFQGLDAKLLKSNKYLLYFGFLCSIISLLSLMQGYINAEM